MSWPREERLRVLAHMGGDMTVSEWALHMGLSESQIRADLMTSGHSDRVTAMRDMMRARSLSYSQAAGLVRIDEYELRDMMRGRAEMEPRYLRRLAAATGHRIKTTYQAIDLMTEEGA